MSGNSIAKKRGKYRFLPLLGGITFLALVVRLITGYQLMMQDPAVLDPSSVTDMRTYLDLSRTIAEGTFRGEFYYQPFYYAVFLPFLRLISFGKTFAPWIAQAVLGAGSVWFTGLCGAQIYGKKAGLAAAAIASCALLLILYPAYALLEILQSFWFILLLYLTLKALREKRLLLWFLTGLVLACSILTRGNSWCFLPVILGCLIISFSRKGERRKGCYALLLLAAGILLPQLPFVIVNSRIRGTLTGPSTAGGNVLALGNSPEAPPGELLYPVTFEVWTRAESLKQRSIPGRILDWAIAEPGAFLELQFRKCLLFWDSRDIPNNIRPDRSAQLSGLVRTLHFLPTGVLLFLALAAIFLNLRTMVRTRHRFLVLTLFIVFYWLAAAAFYLLGRFRVPVLPLLCTAGGCLVPALMHLKRKKHLRLIPAAASFFFAWYLVYPGYGVYREGVEPAIMRIVRPSGVIAPSLAGGVRILDNGPSAMGGWTPVRQREFCKTFALKRPIPPGTPVRFSLCAIRTGEYASVSVNGQTVDLSRLQWNRPVMIGMEIPWPGDGTFRIACPDEGSVLVADLQRDYGRTRLPDGSTFPGELVCELEFLP